MADITTSADVDALMAAASNAAMRALLGVDAAGTDNSTNVTLAGTGSYISIAGQAITVDPITESDISDLQVYITGITGEPISDLSDVTITTPATGEILKWNGSAWINNTLAEAGIAAATHSHPTTDITSGTFSDARIAASNVTQHEAALTITESQISDLGTYSTATGVEDNADVTDATNVASSIAGAAAKSALVDADSIATIDSEAASALKETTWTSIKSFLKTYFDTLYNLYSHPNHTGDVTSTGDGATVISSGAVDIAHLSATGTKDSTTFLRGDNTFASPSATVEGTSVLSTGEVGGSKFLREDGDGTSSWQTIGGGGDALVANPLSQFAATTSAQLAGVLSDETGTGAAVFSSSPALVTPDLGTPSALVGTNITGTAAGLTAGATTGVEAGADVTDTANVTAAGALMDSELTAIASVKALDQGVATTDSPQFAGVNVGHATDTTFSRVSAGLAAIEGKTIQTVDDVFYEEIFIPAGAFAPRTTNGAAVATEEYATNDVILDQYLFDSTTEEGIQAQFALPDSWDRSTIKVKHVWDAATGASAADGVTWGVSVRAVTNDDAIDAAFAASVDTDDTVTAVGDLHMTAASSAVTVSGTPILGDVLLWEVTRVVGDVNDDMAEDAKYLGLWVQFGRVISNSTQW